MRVFDPAAGITSLIVSLVVAVGAVVCAVVAVVGAVAAVAGALFDNPVDVFWEGALAPAIADVGAGVVCVVVGVIASVASDADPDIATELVVSESAAAFSASKSPRILGIASAKATAINAQTPTVNPTWCC